MILSDRSVLTISIHFIRLTERITLYAGKFIYCQLHFLVTVNTSCLQVPFERVGCYKDLHIPSARPLPDYLFNDRDPSIDNYNGRRIDWDNWGVYLPEFACRCAAAAKAKNHTFFGIQFYGN